MTWRRTSKLTLLLCALAGSGRVAGEATLPAPQAAHERQTNRVSTAPAATHDRIRVLLEGSDAAAAQKAIADALEAHPSDPVLHNFAGVADAQQGRAGPAASHFHDAIRLAPKMEAPYLNLGRLHQEQAHVDPAAADAALDIYRRLLAIAPAHTEALYQAAFLLAVRGEFAASQPLVGRLPGSVRENAQVLALQAVTLAGLGKVHEASTAIGTLAAHPDLALADVMGVLPAFRHVSDESVERAMLEALDRRGLTSADALQRLGAIHRRAGRPSEARAVLERAASDRPAPSLLTDLARAAHQQRDFTGALGYLARARDLDPENAGIHFFFGMVCVDLNLGAEAFDSLKKAVALAPENPFINYALGAVAIHRHEPAESLPHFEAYVRLMPGDPRGRFALGAARFYSNLFEQARTDLNQAAPHPETAAGAHYFLGRIARQLNDLTAARRELKSALKAHPLYADAWAELGLVQMREGELVDAEQSITKALSIDPDNYAATLNLATLYSRTKDTRREDQAARLAALQEKRAVRAQEFLRIVEVVP